METLTNIPSDEKELVIARLQVLPPNWHFSSGSDSDQNNLTRDELIDLIEKGDPVGQEFVEIELDFLRAFKDGSLMNLLTVQNV